MSLGTFWFYKCVKLREENKQLKEKVEGYEQTRDRLIEMGFPTFMSCREYAEKLEKLIGDSRMKDKKSFADLIKNIPLCINPCKMCKIYKKHNGWFMGEFKNGEWEDGVCKECCWFYDSKFEIKVE